MKIDKTQISGSKFMFTVACFVQSSSLLTSFLVSILTHDSWIAVLFGAIICIPLVWLFRTIMVMFPDKNLILILEDVYGTIAGKIIGIAYLWFFLTLSSLNLVDLGDFTKSTIMKKTPLIVLLILCLIVCTIAVRNGFRLVTKYSTLFTIVAFTILITTILLVLNQSKLDNFLPMFDQSPMKYIQGTHIITTIPFGELVIFLMIHPNVKMTRRETTKYLFLGFAMGGITLLAVTLRDIAVLGNTLDFFSVPSLTTLRLVNFGPALSRMEILFATVLIMLLFFKITLLFYITVITTAEIFKIKKYRNLVLAIGALIITYGLTLYPSPVKHAESAQLSTPIIWTLFEILIPLLTFIIAKIRKKSKIKEA